MRRRNKLSEQDLAIWSAFARNVRPLPGRQLTPPTASSGAAPAQDRPPQVAEHTKPRQPPARLQAVVIGEQPAGIDNATWRRLCSGKSPAERSIDLHGHTAQRAYVALDLLLHRARAEGVRVVEVITGRGSGDAGGVLKREVPLWLNQPHFRPLILAVTFSHARNTGALRLLLRR